VDAGIDMIERWVRVRMRGIFSGYWVRWRIAVVLGGAYIGGLGPRIRFTR